MLEHFRSDIKLAAYLQAHGVKASSNVIGKWRRIHKIPITNEHYRYREEIKEHPPAEDKLSHRLCDFLKRTTSHCSIEEIADRFDVSPRRVREAVASLEQASFLVNVSDDGVHLEQDMPLPEAPVTVDFQKYRETEFPIGVVADNHIGSKYERIDVLECLFDRFAEYGVERVYQCGNIIDGEARFNKFDIYARGVEEQIANLIEKWPRRNGIVTHFVTGDDHEGWYVQREHIDIGRRIEQDSYAAGRDDLRHLGYIERDIDYEQAGGKARIRVIHAGGGSSYATSYSSQKYAESLQGGEKPQIVLVGHFHKYDHSYPRNIHMVQVGCTEDQTPFMRKKRIEAHVGGVVLWVKQNELGVFTSVKVEWIPFYDRSFYQYHW